jgi:hypothetical protein
MWLGHDWMPYDRFFVVAIVPLSVAVGVGLSALLFHKSQAFKASSAPSWLMAGALVFLCVEENRSDHGQPPFRNEFMSLLANLGTGLQPLLREQDIVATELAGVVPYKIKAKSIDMLGLCDRHIASHGEHQESFGKRSLGYVIAQHPDFYLFQSARDAVPLYGHAAFAPYEGYYRVIATDDYLQFETGEPPMLLVRKDFPRLPEVLEGLQAHTVSFEGELRRLGHVQ